MSSCARIHVLIGSTARAYTAALQIQVARNLQIIGFALSVATLACGLVGVWDVYSRTLSDKRAATADLAKVLAELVEQRFRTIDNLLVSIQASIDKAGVENSIELRDFLEGNDTRRLMVTLGRDLPALDSIAFVDDMGNRIDRGLDIRDFTISDDFDFSALRDTTGSAFAMLPHDNDDQKLVAVMSKRIYARNGGFLGSAAAVLDIGYLGNIGDRTAAIRSLKVSFRAVEGSGVSPPPATGAQGIGSIPLTVVHSHPLNGYPLIVDVSTDVRNFSAAWWQEAIYIGTASSTLALGILILFAALAHSLREKEAQDRRLAQSAEALRESEVQLDRAQEIASLGSWERDLVTGEAVWSRNLYRLRGQAPDADLSAKTVVGTYHPDDLPKRQAWLEDLRMGRDRPPIDLRMIGPDGQIRVLQLEGRAVVDAAGKVHRIAGTTRDVTELRLLESKLAQAEKMEAIGKLAGGIAHDFNNILGVIIGNLELLSPLLDNQPEATELCSEALDGASSCADLVRRLLAFARRQPLHPQITDANALLLDIGRLIRRTLGAAITVKIDLNPDLWDVLVDPVQLQAAIVNLATNARDAMPKGGTLLILTRNVSVAAEEASCHGDADPGDYATITVHDTGGGISTDVLDHIFEPFFTTKDEGRGTGLGLAMVFGFVKQSGGHVAVWSEPGVGTSFCLYLPRADQPGSVARLVQEMQPSGATPTRTEPAIPWSAGSPG